MNSYLIYLDEKKNYIYYSKIENLRDAKTNVAFMTVD